MKWEEVRKMYSEKWILFEALEAHSESGKRVVDDLSVVNVFERGNDALKEYAEKHKKDKNRELYVYSTKNKELCIEERSWIGVRKNG